MNSVPVKRLPCSRMTSVFSGIVMLTLCIRLSRTCLHHAPNDPHFDPGQEVSQPPISWIKSSGYAEKPPGSPLTGRDTPEINNTFKLLARSETP